MHKAMTGIWIAEDAADDHRQVIDWLNQNTPESVQFFLAELKTWRIGESAPAPQLDVVCRPNIAIKPAPVGMSDADQKRYEWRRAFWTDIHARIQAAKPPFRMQRPGPDHWSTIALGRSGFTISMLLTPRNGSVAVELYVSPQGWKQSAFEQLLAQRDVIEAELGRPLDWRPMTDKNSSRIILDQKGLDPMVDKNRETIKDWFAVWTPKMYAAFKERVRKLREEAELAIP